MGRSLVHDICAGSIATTGTPVNIIRFGAVCILTIELLTFVSTEAMNAVFTIAVTACRFQNADHNTLRFAPGSFHLEKFSFRSVVIAVLSLLWMVFMIIAAFFFPATDHTTDATIQLVLGGFMALPISWYFRPAYGGVHWFNGFISNLTPTITGENNDENSIERRHNVVQISPYQLWMRSRVRVLS